MFTLIGAALGVLIATITVTTNFIALSTLTGLSFVLVYMIIFASYMSFGAFIGLVVDVVVNKIRK